MAVYDMTTAAQEQTVEPPDLQTSASAPVSSDNSPKAYQNSEADKALAKKILATIRQDKRFHRKAFEKMRRDMGVALRGYDDKIWTDELYSANISGRHVKQKTAALYAKNPKVTARRRDMMDFATWDENPDTLMLAYQTINTFAQQQQQHAAMPPQVDPATGLPTVEPPPPPPPGLAQAQATMQDFQTGTSLRQQAAKMGKTLEMVFAYQLDHQQPLSFKQAMKQAVRRASTTGVAYAELGYQRDMGPRPGLQDQLEDSRQRLDHLEHLVEEVAEGDINEDDSEMAELKASITAMQTEPDVVVREGLIIDYPRSTKLIPDRLCTQLEGFVDARHISREMLYTVDEVEELFKVDLKMGEYTSYSAIGRDDDRPTRRMRYDEDGNWATDKEGRIKSAGMVCVYKHWVKASGLLYYIADGYDGFLKAPGPPDVTVDEFWPVYSLSFNTAESETDLYPRSDVALLKAMQQDYNASRQGQREHRKAARPRWGVQRGALDDDDIEALENGEPFDVIPLNIPQGAKLSDILQGIPVPGVDPNLYATDQYFTDMQLVVGSQAATMGGISQATATETSVAANSMAATDQSSIDDLDAFLTAIVRAGGAILFKELAPETATKIAGPGALWPQLDDQEIAEQITLEIQAGSSGRPNQGVEINNWKEMLPFLIQMPNVSHMWLARETIRRLDDNADLTEAITENIPSVVAANAAANGGQPGQGPANPNAPGGPPGQPGGSPGQSGAQIQPGTGNPATEPTAQGPQGVNNGPAPPANPSGGSGPAFGSNQV